MGPTPAGEKYLCHPDGMIGRRLLIAPRTSETGIRPVAVLDRHARDNANGYFLLKRKRAVFARNSIRVGGVMAN